MIGPYEAKIYLESLIRFIGDNPERDGLEETPKRILKSWETLFSGYNINPKDIVKDFEEPFSGLVLSRNIPFFSTCEHHWLPFIGTAHIAYIPDEASKRVLGASKLIRLLEVFTRRLTIQERIAEQVTSALMSIKPTPVGAACVLEAQHLCMACRGVEKQGADLVVSVYKGSFLHNETARMELLQLIRK